MTSEPGTVPEPPATRFDVDRLRDLADRSRSALMTYVGVGSVLVIFTLWLAATEPTFATYDNFINILNTNAVLLVAAIGLTLVLLVGGFDLSIGGVLALSGVLCAKLISIGVPAGAAIFLVVVGGALLGAVFNGLAIARLGLSFFVVTLGTASVFGGAALLITGGESQDLYSEPLLRDIGSGTIAGVPWPVVIAVTVLALALIVTRYTGYGRMIYAVGGNEEAARLSGINVTAIRVSAGSPLRRPTPSQGSPSRRRPPCWSAGRPSSGAPVACSGRSWARSSSVSSPTA
jgi:ribose transport system permease protein